MKIRRKYKKSDFYYFDTTDYIQYRRVYVKIQIKCLFWFNYKKYRFKLKSM